MPEEILGRIKITGPFSQGVRVGITETDLNSRIIVYVGKNYSAIVGFIMKRIIE